MTLRHTVGRYYRMPFQAFARATGSPLPLWFNGHLAWWPVAIWPGFRHRYEPHMEAAVRRLLSPGMGFADIGSHHGIWSGVASTAVGPRGQVIACEPSPAFETLAAHLGRRGNVRLVRTAVGAEAGEVTFFAHGELTTGSVQRDITEVCRTQDPDLPITPLTVPMDTLDHLLGAALDRRWLVKIDVEGHEAAVVRGATRLVESDAVDWLIEMHPGQLKLSGQTEADVLGPLERSGYTVKVIDHLPTGMYTVAASRAASRLP